MADLGEGTGRKAPRNLPYNLPYNWQYNRRALAIAAAAALAIGIFTGNAIVERRRAQQRFDALRQLAGAFLFEFHGAIARLPGSAPARELVVERTLQYLDSISSEAGNGAALKRELAEQYLRLGAEQSLDSEANLSMTRAARASYQKAVALYGEIAKASPNDPRAVTDLARAGNELASSMAATGDVEKGFALLRDAAASLETLDRKRKLDGAGRFALGRTYSGLSEFQRGMRHKDESLQARLRSIEIFGDLARDPRNQEALRWYGTAEMRLASLYMLEFHDQDKASEILDVAIRIDEQRVAANQSDAAAKMDLTLAQSYLAALLQRKGALPAAERLYQSTMAVRKGMLAADPDNYRLRYLLVTDYTHLGDLLRLEKKPAAARAVYKEGLAMALPLVPRAANDAEALQKIAELRKKAAE